mgnify:CR=1 FL=1
MRHTRRHPARILKGICMTISMYKASIPVFTRTLSAQSAILGKAAAYAEARKIEPSVLLNARLYPDMFPFTRQVQIACDFAKGAGARLAGLDVPSYPDDEASFDELKARIAKTLAFIGALKAEQIDGSDSRDISLKIRGQPLEVKGVDYSKGKPVDLFLYRSLESGDQR